MSRYLEVQGTCDWPHEGTSSLILRPYILARFQWLIISITWNQITRTLDLQLG